MNRNINNTEQWLVTVLIGIGKRLLGDVINCKLRQRTLPNIVINDDHASFRRKA